MHNEFGDFLPFERVRALRRDYRLRLTIVTLWCVAAIAILAGLLLLPTYFSLLASAHEKETRLANVESALSSPQATALSARLAALTDEAAALTALGEGSSASPALRAALGISRPGITLSNMKYRAADGKNPATLSLSGVAATRVALRKYQVALQNGSFATSADLPISAYAEDVNIPFTITMTLAP